MTPPRVRPILSCWPAEWGMWPVRARGDLAAGAVAGCVVADLRVVVNSGVALGEAVHSAAARVKVAPVAEGSGVAVDLAVDSVVAVAACAAGVAIVPRQTVSVATSLRNQPERHGQLVQLVMGL